MAPRIVIGNARNRLPGETPNRIEVVTDDDAVDAVIAGVAFARGAGLLGNAHAWVSASVADVFASSNAMAVPA